MGSRQIVKKKPSSRKASAPKPGVRSKKVPSAPEDTSTKSVLRRPSGLTISVPASTRWCEFTPQNINEKRCLARTWDDGYGGQCTRLALNDTLKLCAAHKVESERPLGLTHGFVTGAIPPRKLEEFENVRAFRQAARLERSYGLDASVAREAVMEAYDDIAPANVPARHGDEHLRSVHCWRQKTIRPRRKPSERLKGGKAFGKEHFEQIAMKATKSAPESLFQQVGYPVPLLGSLRCALLGFERDLDGIRPTSICTYEWRFLHEQLEAVEATHRVKYKCRNLFYKRTALRPPWSVRTAACVARALVNTSCLIIKEFWQFCSNVCDLCCPDMRPSPTNAYRLGVPR